MEVAALGGLLGLGWVVSRLGHVKSSAVSGVPTTGLKEPFVSQRSDGPKPLPANGIMKPGSQTVALRSPADSALSQTPQGASAVGNSPDLDLFYATPGGRTYPSEPNPGPYGMPVGYATQQPPLASPTAEPFAPAPVTSEDATAQVQMNAAGVEMNPNYMSDDVVSSLSGRSIPSGEFKHNNMVPYFGGRVKQNMRANVNNSLLDQYTGAGYTQISKKEVENMFDTQRPFGNPFGMESSTDFIESRINTPRNRGGERPFEPTRVGPGVGEKFGMTGKGGFQQLEVNEIMRPKTTDELRVATNPKLSYGGVVVPGASFVTNPMESPGEVRKYRPDRFYVDETNARAGAAAPVGLIKETVRSIQVLPDTTRTETTTEAFGPAAAQDTHQSYVTGSYRNPMTQQFGGAGFRNADMSSYYTKNVEGESSEGFASGGPTSMADYGRRSFENRPNERTATSERTMALNLIPAESGQVPVHYLDDARPTRRNEMEDGVTDFGPAVGYASGAPSVTVWDPNDVARTTVKETTLQWDYRGIASSASAPNRLKVYDPKDIARPTQKAQLSNRQYFGNGNNPGWGVMDETFAYNMRTNPNKEQIARGRKPIAGSGGLALNGGDPGAQTARKLWVDDINDRANAVNRVEGLGPGVGDIGQVKYRVPLRLDVSAERLTPDIVSAVDNNPLQQSIHRNAALASQVAAY